MSRYIGILCKDEDSAYGLHVSDLPECVAEGDTMEEALANASLALRLGLAGIEEVPKPSAMAAMLARPDVCRDLVEGSALVISAK